MNESENQWILRQTIDAFEKLSDTEFQAFLALCQPVSFDRNQAVLNAGDYHHGMYFVATGSIGLYELLDGKEMFQNFFLPGEFAIELQSLSSQKPTTKYLRSLTPTTGYYIPRKELIHLYEASIVYERLGRKLLEYLLQRQNTLAQVLQSLKPEERYRYLEAERPDLLAAIPLSLLAPYLGLARETLSRIRSKK